MSSLCVDMYADTLMWNRDLLSDNRFGHVYLPKLKRGQIKLIGFPIIDLFRFFARLRGWPKDVLKSFNSRAHWQIDYLEQQCQHSNNRLAIVKERESLSQILDHDMTGVLLGIQGAQAFSGNLAKVERFYNRGIRFIGITHLFNNEYGCCQKWYGKDDGLTKTGLRLPSET